MMDEAGIPFWLLGIQCLFQRLQHEVGPHRTADSPADDPAGKDVDDEGDIDESLPDRNVGEIRNLQQPTADWDVRP